MDKNLEQNSTEDFSEEGKEPSNEEILELLNKILVICTPKQKELIQKIMEKYE